MDEITAKPAERGLRHQGPAHSCPYPTSRLGAPVDLVDLAREIAAADAMISARVTAKLEVIADQIRALQAEARKILAEARRDRDLHAVECRFRRVPGKTYHLYRRGDGRRYFSMLAPQDWGGSPPDTYLGAYRLGPDQSWRPAEEGGGGDQARRLVERLLAPSGLGE